MPRKKQIVQKQRRRKVYREGEFSGEATKVKPKGFFKVFFSYRTFAIIGVVALGAGLLISAFYAGSGTAGRNDDGSVRGPDVIRKTTEPQATPDPDSGASGNIKQYSAPPQMSIDPSKRYFATIRTEKGDIRIELFADQAPTAVNNFVFLARDGFYDGVTFFRVIEDFVAQTGDPTGTGSGGPGYTLPVENTDDEFVAGTVGVAKPDDASSPNNGSQFFITIDDEPTLTGKNTAIGRVVEGMDVVQQLTPRDPRFVRDVPGDRIETIVIEEQ